VPPPYLVDTNVYIRSSNDAAFAARFEVFQRSTDPLFVSTVVLAEVILGARDPSIHDDIVTALTAGTTAHTPISDDWLVAASAIARLGGEAVTKSRSFWNDAILAAQCERLGMTLITQNTADFRRLGRFIGVTVEAPFPRT
jgi:predicted nucleic acid-binding protein